MRQRLEPGYEATEVEVPFLSWALPPGGMITPYPSNRFERRWKATTWKGKKTSLTGTLADTVCNLTASTRVQDHNQNY